MGGVTASGQRPAKAVVLKQFHLLAVQRVVSVDLLVEYLHVQISADSARQWLQRQPLVPTMGRLRAGEQRKPDMPRYNPPQRVDGWKPSQNMPRYSE